MSRRTLTIIAFTCAVVLTTIGWQQAMISYAQPRLLKLALWFPFDILIQPFGDVPRLSVTLIQFPVFAAAFALGIRRWGAASVTVAVMLVYSLFVAAAVVSLRFR
jgi:hypothetical protein